MTESTAAGAIAAKVKTVAEDMDQRRIFANPEDAAAYLNASMAAFADFDQHPLITRGIGDDGNFDLAVYVPGQMVPMVAVLTNQAKDEKGNALPRKVKAIVVTPVPTREAILASPEGVVWLDKMLHTQLNHIAVRALRGADDVTTVADQMPTTLEGFISSSRDSTGGIMDTFNELFPGIKAAIGDKSKAWATARLLKTDLKKALESKAFALEYFPVLEDRGDKPSMFVMAAQLGIKTAKGRGLDPTIFERWLATRDTKALKTTEGEDEDFSLDDLSIPADEAQATPAADAPSDSTTAPADAQEGVTA